MCSTCAIDQAPTINSHRCHSEVANMRSRRAMDQAPTIVNSSKPAINQAPTKGNVSVSGGHLSFRS